MSGVRRVEAPSRANTQIVHLDVGRGIVKVNPLAGWTDDDIADVQARPRPARAPARRAGLPVDRVLAVHAGGRAGRRPAFGSVGGHRQDRMRTPRLAAAVGVSTSKLVPSSLMQRSDLSSRRARSRVDPPPPRGRGRVRAAVPAVLGRQGQRRDAAHRQEGVLAGAPAVPGHARRHRAQLPRGHRVPRPPRSSGSTSASSSRRSRSRSTRAASSRTPARARRATGCRPRPCSTRSRSTSSTR